MMRDASSVCAMLLFLVTITGTMKDQCRSSMNHLDEKFEIPDVKYQIKPADKCDFSNLGMINRQRSRCYILNVQK